MNSHADRNSLSRDERDVLEMRVLPTARRWLRECPGLAQHAAKTLAHWGEPIEDDFGKPYTGPMA